ncbi:MAG: hypothetical protein KC933_08530 [Myxococcales bacterium]|nr:hypothetical protein [Myxococcales bacterium]MCB9649502.1 hypothetical protein [Deltaproteobacteria bacterium]
MSKLTCVRLAVAGVAVCLCAPALAQVGTSSTAPTQNLADPVGIPVAEPWYKKLRYELLVLSTARWQQDNGDLTEAGHSKWNPSGENFGDLVTTIGGSVGYERFLFAARFDTAFYFHKPVAAESASPLIQLDLQDRYVNQVRPEYIAFSYNGPDASVVLGDYYMTLGRGMVLSVRKVGDVGVDNKLTGARVTNRVKLPVGDLSLTEFAGWSNIKNYETGTGYYYPERPSDAADPDKRFYDALDFVTGGRAEYSLGKYMKVGAHAAQIASPEDELGERATVRGYGANVELPRPVKWASLYVEAARLTRDDSRLETPKNRQVGQALTDVNEEGWGLYSNANLYFGPATVLIEGKYYDNMFNVFPRGIRQPRRQVLNRLVEPPTAERPLTLLLANNTVYGGRMRVDYRVAPGWVPYLAGGLYRDNSFGRQSDGTAIDTVPPTNISAIYGGARVTQKWAEISVEGGYRTQRNHYSAERKQASDPDEAQRAKDLDGSTFRDDMHVMLDYRMPVWGPLSVEVALNYLLARQENATVDCRDVPAVAETDEEEREVDACNTRGADQVFVSLPDQWHEGRLALSVISSQGFSITGAYEFYTRQPTVYKQHYFSIGGQWKFMDGSIVRALYGGERAGLKCSGGVCRFFPGFEGGRIELEMRL